MTQIMLEESARKKLGDLMQPIEIVDEAGRVLGTFTPRNSRDPQISEAELDRREQETESFSTAEVLENLEKHSTWPCKAGSAKDQILWIAPDFDAPLAEVREGME